MNLKHLKDSELLTQTKRLVENERHLVTQVLQHLREVSRRKLFSDLGYSSIFDYAVKEPRYSETQASRRIQAMRLLQELPEVEEKITTGKLSLTHLSSAQRYFKEVEKKPPVLLETLRIPKPLDRTEKLKILKRLENTSTREGEKILLTLQPQASLPKERERLITEQHTEVRFVINGTLKKQLEDVRALLGPKGAAMNFAELVTEMARLSVESLASKKFGKKRTQKEAFVRRPNELSGNSQASPDNSVSQVIRRESIPIAVQDNLNPKVASVQICTTSSNPLAAPQVKTSKLVRYIPRSVKHAVWIRDHGTCVRCGSRRNIHYDHIRPAALGGGSSVENLRLLFFMQPTSGNKELWHTQFRALAPAAEKSILKITFMHLFPDFPTL